MSMCVCVCGVCMSDNKSAAFDTFLHESKFEHARVKLVCCTRVLLLYLTLKPTVRVLIHSQQIEWVCVHTQMCA